MRLYPLLLRPRLLGLKNRWIRGGGQSRVREVGLLLISLLLAAGIYFCTSSALSDTQKLFKGMPLNPEIPLGMIVTALAGMLLLSASVASLGSLFLARDLDLVLATPLKRWQFVLGRCGEVAISTGWMLIVFGAPALIAFGIFFNAHPIYFILSPVICALLMALPVTLSLVIALLFGAAVPAQRGRDVFLFLFAITLGAMAIYLNSPEPTPGAAHSHGSGDLLMFTRLSRISSYRHSPFAYATHALATLMHGEIGSSIKAIAYIGILVLASLAAAVGLFNLLYERAYAAAQSQRTAYRINSRFSQRFARVCMPFLSSPERALITKEFKIFSRDLSHTVQLGMLLAICFVYLYNFRSLKTPSHISAELIPWWEAFLMLCNVALSSLVVTSVCSRFVFPSISLEGGSFWLIQSAPLTPREVLKTKFRAWFVPVACISSVIFISGALALQADGPLVLATCIAGIVLCYGLVAIGIGVGAIFSQFDWDYSAQLSTNIGSFIFMFLAFIVLMLDLIPLGMLFGTHAFLPQDESGMIFSTKNLTSIGCLTAMFLLNRLLADWALHAGAKALTPK